MNWALAGQLAVCGIVFFFAWRAFCDWANRRPVAPTVEQEEAKAREVAAHAPQWNGVPARRLRFLLLDGTAVTVTVPETHQYTHFDIDDSTPEPLSTFSRERGKAL